MLSVEIFKVGELSTNCYVISEVETNRFAIIDPGDVTIKLMQRINEVGVENFDYILLTHGHFDHMGSVKLISNLTGAKIVIGNKEEQFIMNSSLNLSVSLSNCELSAFNVDLKVSEGDIINLGTEKIKVIETPGHTIGSICYISDGKIFSGDTLFCGDFGRTDLPSGSINDMKSSIKRLLSIEGMYQIYPGHGEITTLDSEKQYNVLF